MSKKRLIKGFLLQSDNSSIVKEIMMSPRDEKFVNTLLYQRITLNMYIDAYRFNHGITNDENLPDYLQELIRIYKLFDLCIKQLPYELIEVYSYLFERNYSMDDATWYLHASKTSIFRYKNLIVKTLKNCLNT